MVNFGNRHFQLMCISVLLSILGISNAKSGDLRRNARRSQPVDPCVDFYEHVCGNWSTEHPGIADNFRLIAKKINSERGALLKELLEQKGKTEDKVFTKLSNYYRSCINFENGSESNGLEYLFKIVRDNRGWPLTFRPKKWPVKIRQFMVESIHQKYSEIVEEAALFVVSPISYGTPTEKFYHPGITLAKRRLIKPYDHYMKGSLEIARKFVKWRKSGLKDSTIEIELTEMFKFGEALSSLSSTDSSSLTTVSEIQRKWDKIVSGHPELQFDWLRVIRQPWAKLNIKSDATTKIHIEPSNLIEKLGDLLMKHGLRTVVNWIHWSAIADLIPHANKAIAKSFVGSEKTVTSPCISGPINDHGMWYLYVKKYAKNFKKLRPPIDDMVTDIMKVLRRRISDSKWLDNKMKTRFDKKFSNILRNIGYPTWYDESGKIDAYLSNLTFGSNYLRNRIDYNRFRNMQTLQKVGQCFDRSEWNLSPLHPNAYYSSLGNYISIPVSIIQEPFFNATRNRNVNGGFMGTLIAHEIAHAMDPLGHLCNNIGSPQKLSKSYLTAYNERIKCFQDQYSNFPYKTLTPFGKKSVQIDGTKTVRENFSDNISIGVCYEAFRAKDSNPKEFFYSFGKAWCSVVKYLPHSHDHAPASVRINIALSNMPEFSQVFGCKIGSPMNPEKKCDFWQ